jgi:hypothetical protein
MFKSQDASKDGVVDAPSDSVIFDKADQAEKCRGVLLDGETLQAVYDEQGVSSGFVGITDRRLIYYNGQLTSKAKVIQSMPWRNISTVGALDKGRFARGFFGSSELLVTTVDGATIHMKFRSNEKAHDIHQAIAQHIL